MVSHKDVLAEVGLEFDDIAVPDLCLVGEYLGPTGELSMDGAETIKISMLTPMFIHYPQYSRAPSRPEGAPARHWARQKTGLFEARSVFILRNMYAPVR